MKMMMMMKQEESTGGGAFGEASAITNWGGHRVCHTCGGTSSSAAYSCSACDRNERVVRICDACELAPAVLYCKADAASLCPSCDAHIHSVNHLARRHHRVSILHPGAPAEEEGGQNDDDEAASWLLPNPHDDGKLIINMNEAALVVDDNKEDLDTVEYMSTMEEGYGYGGGGEEGVVPFQLPFERYHNFNVTSLFDDDDFYDDDESSSPKPSTSTNYNHHAVNYMEVGVVPDDDESTEKGRFVHQEMLTSTTNASTSPAAIKLRGKEREARVVRYREKKLRRKFEKTIRYASRKAYAETRPRIKGRFAKRSSKLVNNINIDHHHSLFSAAAPIISSHDDQTSSTGGGGGGSYGQVVPSFY